MNFIQILLLPASLLYGCSVWLRNKFYDWGIFPSREFDFPVIGIGNLSAGGSGKTPHTEYLIRILKDKFRVSTLSRGYGRSTSGFIAANENSSSTEIGDEPKQYKKKFPGILVAVDENRIRGIKNIKNKFPETEIVLLDDAYQHRSVKPGLNILLTDYGKPYYEDFILPAGRLRESKKGRFRADVIIVTKTPDNFTHVERRLITKKINTLPHQQLYFSYIRYGNPVYFWEKKEKAGKDIKHFSKNKFSCILLSGIANPKPLENFLKNKFQEITPLEYRDHHEYTLVDMYKLKEEFEKIKNENKIIITTEKDAMRLEKPGMLELIKGLPIFYLPIEIAFRDNDEEELRKQVNDFLRSKITVKKNN